MIAGERADAERADQRGGSAPGRVVDAMRVGVITCPPDTSMAAVARMMAANRVHAIVVTGLFDGEPWGVVSDQDVLRVAARGGRPPAAACASRDVVTVDPERDLEGAAELMLREAASHLVVVDRRAELPLGVLSTLDVAAWLGGEPIGAAPSA